MTRTCKSHTALALDGNRIRILTLLFKVTKLVLPLGFLSFLSKSHTVAFPGGWDSGTGATTARRPRGLGCLSVSSIMDTGPGPFRLVHPQGRILDKWSVDQDRGTTCTLPERD